MSHPEQLAFFRCVADTNADILAGGRLLEIGSYDVNGSIRAIFSSAHEHVGVDLAPGPGVDLVSFGHDVDLPDASFDATVSGECFEHDPHWPDTLANMARLTRPGGLVAFTCASRGRPEHGTTRSDSALSPGTSSRGLDYYRNLDAADVEGALPLKEWFRSYRMWYLPQSFDLYFAGVRAGEPPAGRPSAQLPPDDRVRHIRTVMSTPHRVVRWPLRLAVRALPQDWFQNFAVRYWGFLLRAQDRFAGGRFRRAEH